LIKKTKTMIVNVSANKKDVNSFLNEECKNHFRQLLKNLQRENEIDIQAAQAAQDETFLVNLILRQKDINDALERIKKGTYGLCEESHEMIPIDRLYAMPDTRYTKRIQQEWQNAETVPQVSPHYEDEYFSDHNPEDHSDNYEQREYNF
jgi:RNA polymerase-binding transcription factor DksA